MARVLIVEDELPLRRVITLSLVRHGYSVAEASNVTSATEALEAWDGGFDVILLDVNLPDQTGWDLLRRLRARAAPQRGGVPSQGAPPKIIVITAVRPSQARLDEFHPDAMLVKPFPLHALLRLIQRQIGEAPPGEADGEGEESTAAAEAPPANEIRPG